MKLLQDTETKLLATIPAEECYGYATDTERYFCWKDGWQDAAIDSNMQLSLYDLNKQILTQVPELTEKQIANKINLINEFVQRTWNRHYLLYGKEISYFTLFQKHSDCTETLGEAAIDCLQEVGAIKSIELTEQQDAIEIWIAQDTEATCLYLFPYDSGIVLVKAG